MTDSDIDAFRVTLPRRRHRQRSLHRGGRCHAALEGGALLFSGVGEAKFREDRRLSQSLPAGRYTVEFRYLPAGLYLKSARSGLADVLRDGLTVSGGGTIPLDLVLSDEVGALEGAVQDEGRTAGPRRHPGADSRDGLAPAIRPLLHRHHRSTTAATISKTSRPATTKPWPGTT